MNTSKLRRRAVVLMVLFSAIANVSVAQPPEPTTEGISSGLVENLRSATDMGDQRGFFFGPVSMDGNLMVSDMTGNLMYNKQIASFKKYGETFTLTLNYNQNASYTAFRKYIYGENRWEQFSQNRPLWSFGLGGFAIQTLSSCSAPYLGDELRNSAPTYRKKDFTDLDMVWAVEGWDYCNSMEKMDNTADKHYYTDVIKLLREDGSVLNLTHVKHTGSSLPDMEDEDYYTGLYVSSETNTHAHAYVATDEKLLSSVQATALHDWFKKHESKTEIPKRYLPRRVLYYTDDGLEYEFHEDIAPYGIDMFLAAGPGADERNMEGGAQWAGPRTLYLRKISKNGVALAELMYRGMETRKTPDDKATYESRYGRYELMSINGNINFDYNLGGVDIHHEGEMTAITSWCPDNLSTGYDGRCVPFRERASNALRQEKGYFNSWTGLVTGIQDPAGRFTRFEYEYYQKKYLQVNFPYKYAEAPLNESNLTLTSARIKTMTDDASKKALSYYLPETSTPDVFSNWTLGAWLKTRDKPAEAEVDRTTKFELRYDAEASNRPKLLVDKFETSVVSMINKYDHSGSSEELIQKTEYSYDKNAYASLASEIVCGRKITDYSSADILYTSTLLEHDNVREIWDRYDRMYLLAKTDGKPIPGLPVVSKTSLIEHIERSNGMGTRELYQNAPLDITGVTFTTPSGGVVHSSTVVVTGKDEFKFTYDAAGDPEVTEEVFFRRTAWEHLRTPAPVLDVTTMPYYTDVLSAVYGYAIDSVREHQQVNTNVANPDACSWAANLITTKKYLHISSVVEEVSATEGQLPEVRRKAFLDWLRGKRALGTIYSKEEQALLQAGETDESEWLAAVPEITTYVHDVHLAQKLYLLLRTTVQNPNDDVEANHLLSETLYSYDVTPLRITGFDANANPSFGYVTSKKEYGRDGIYGPFETTYDYEDTKYNWQPYVLQSKTTDPLGVETNLWYRPETFSTWASWASGGAVAAMKVKNMSPVNPNAASRKENLNVSVIGAGSLLYEKPSLTERSVRGYTMNFTTGLPEFQTNYLRTANVYGRLGLLENSVDENGYLTSLTYDAIGRLKMMWLPMDFPHHLEGHEWHNYDAVELKREISLPRGSAYSYTLRQYRMYPCDCDDFAYVGPPPPGYFGAGNGLIAFSRGHFAPCSRIWEMMTMLDIHRRPEEPQPDPCIYEPYVDTETTWVSQEIEYIPWEMMEVSSAKLKLRVADLIQLPGFLPAKYVAFNVTYTNTNKTGETFTIPYHAIGNLDGTDTPPNPVEKDAEIVIELDKDLFTGTGTSPLRCTVEVKVPTGKQPVANAGVEFSKIWIEFEGKFRKWNTHLDEDFTLAYVHQDGNGPQRVRYRKIDDDANSYSPDAFTSTGPRARHAMTHTFMGDDYLPKETRWNYAAGIGNAFPATYPDFLSIEKKAYNADGEQRYNFNPFEHGTRNEKITEAENVPLMQSGTVTYRPSVTQTYKTTEQSQYWGWLSEGADYVSGSPFPTTSSLGSTVKTYFGWTSDFSDWPSDLRADFHGAYTCEIMKPNLTDNNGTTAKYVNALGQTILEIEGYDQGSITSVLNGTTPAGYGVNLVTRYKYDPLGRLEIVTNPAGHITRYWYDNRGRVRYLYQNDKGITSFCYDKMGRLRFTQTAEQAHATPSRVTYMEYDDLGRKTLTGEAKIAKPEGMIEDDEVDVLDITHAGRYIILDRLTDVLYPNILNIDNVDDKYASNKTLWLAPARAVPAANLGGIALVTACGNVAFESVSDRFNPAIPPVANKVIEHATTQQVYTNIVSNTDDFEHAGMYPENILRASFCDNIPPANSGAFAGVVWTNMPVYNAWKGRMLHTDLGPRNLKGRVATEAYREHGAQPFHYVMYSYDERGRIEAKVRYTENLGFDATYYAYNSLDLVISVHTVDPVGQHAAFYEYDREGHLTKTYAAQQTGTGFGFGVTLFGTRPALIGKPTGDPDVEVEYNVLDLPMYVKYPAIDVNIGHAYSQTGKILRRYNQDGLAVLDDRYSYDANGRLIKLYQKYHEVKNSYNYNSADQLLSWQGMGVGGRAGTTYNEAYQYDLAGNRTDLTTLNPGGALAIFDHYTYANAGSGTHDNWLTSTVRTVNAVVTGGDVIAYNQNGSMTNRTRRYTENGRTSDRAEAYSYDAFELVERLDLHNVVADDAVAGPCVANSTVTPLEQWRYRYSMDSEREQKRQYLNGQYTRGLAWVYYDLSASNKQMSVWNGLQGQLCGGDANANIVRMWNVERNVFGPADTRVIMRPDGTKDYSIPDYLGSSSVSYHGGTNTIERTLYRPFGEPYTNTNLDLLARTGFVGCEQDNESDLSLHGVRMFDNGYGRFMRVDPQYDQFSHIQPFHYSFNNPVTLRDVNGEAPEDPCEDDDVPTTGEVVWSGLKTGFWTSATVVCFIVPGGLILAPVCGYNAMTSGADFAGQWSAKSNGQDAPDPLPGPNESLGMLYDKLSEETGGEKKTTGQDVGKVVDKVEAGPLGVIDDEVKRWVTPQSRGGGLRKKPLPVGSPETLKHSVMSGGVGSGGMGSSVGGGAGGLPNPLNLPYN